MTDIEKRIEEEAEKQSKSLFVFNVPNITDYCKNLVRDSIKHGANFVLHQNRWRKVEEELPEVNIKVIVKTINGNYSISEMYIPKDCHGTVLGDKEWKGSHSFKASITEWKPIESE